MTGTAEKLERAAGLVVVVLVGLAFLAVGLSGAVYEIQHPPIERPIVYVCVAMAIFGALLLPSVFTVAFPRVKQIFVLIFPNGLPLVGGRRRDDPPAGGGA